MSTFELSIIIVSYNTRDLTLQCVRSVFEQTHVSGYEIIVFDNASKDGSADAVESEFGESVVLIRSEVNHGFAAGNNIAVSKARGRYFLLLNPDTVVLDGAIDKLILFAETNPGARIWGGKTIFPSGVTNPTFCWQRQTIWSLLLKAIGLTSLFPNVSFLNPEAIGSWNNKNMFGVDVVSGCFFLIESKLWNQLGGFREQFFMYGEEADLCLRAAKFGARPLVDTSICIIHYGGASEKVRADKLVRLLKAKCLLVELHFTCNRRDIGIFLLYLWPFSRCVVHSILALLGRLQSKEASQAWCQVLKRKKEWMAKKPCICQKGT